MKRDPITENAPVTPQDIIAEARFMKDDFQLGEFPIEAFSNRTRQFILSIHKHLRFKKDYLGINILCAIGVAMGKRFRIEINNTFHDYPGLFYVMVGYPSIGKTPPTRLILKPLLLHNREVALQYNQELEAFYQKLEKYENTKDKEGLEKPKPPRKSYFITQDYTLEWLVYALECSKTECFYTRTRLPDGQKLHALFQRNGREYLWNERYNHSDIIYNRKGEDFNIVVTEPLISVIGGTQIEQLKHLIDGDKTENGFMSRLLFAYPLDQKLELADDDDVPEQELNWWNSFVEEILNLKTMYDSKETNVIPKNLKLSKEAKTKFMEWKQNNIDMINEMNGNGNGILASYFGKLSTALGRLCLIIQTERWRNGEAEMKQIDLVSVQRAILLIEYFRKVFYRIYFYFFVDNDIHLTELERNVYAALPEEFETKIGKEIAIQNGMPARTFDRFIGDSQRSERLFSKQKHGIYKKMYNL